MSIPNLQEILNNAAKRNSLVSRPVTAQQSSNDEGNTSNTTSGLYQAMVPNFCMVPFEPSIGQDEEFRKLRELLRDDKIAKIGICGMGGIGKTTLMRRLHNECLVYSDFDLIIWLVMSKDLNDLECEKLIFDKNISFPCALDFYIQMELMKYVYPHKAGDHSESYAWDDFLMKAQPHQISVLLYNILSRKRFFLLIDNAWQHVDITKLGIPEPNEANKSKLILATRSKEISCVMNVDAVIELGCWNSGDSWKLFEKHTGEKALNSHPSIKASVANEIVKECGGLPLAIVVVARAMSSKYNLRSWEHALVTLQNYPYDMPDISNKLFGCLKLSYDALEDDTIKVCFLYCALFPEGDSMDKQRLIRYWMGEGFLGEFENLIKMYNRGYNILEALQAACLLQKGDEIQMSVKMHDVIRDMTLWIVSDYGAKRDTFFVHPGLKLTRTEIANRWRNARRIFVLNLCELPHSPRCPYLSTLIFRKYMSSHSISNYERNAPNSRPKVPKVELLFAKATERGIIQGESSTSQSLVPIPEFYPMPSDDSAGVVFVSNFTRMASLRVLDLSYISLFDFNEITQQILTLRYLGGISFSVMPQKIGNFSNLEILDLGKNSPNSDLPSSVIQSLLLEVGRLTNLKILDLSNNTFISKLPDSIGELHELRQLSLKGTWLEMLPANIGFLANLEILDLSKSRIIELPITIGQLNELRQLNLASSWIRKLPVEVSNLKTLEMLDLSDNQLHGELPSAIKQLPQLREINLHNTAFYNLPLELANLVIRPLLLGRRSTDNLNEVTNNQDVCDQ